MKRFLILTLLLFGTLLGLLGLPVRASAQIYSGQNVFPLAAHKVGFIGDSRYNNINGWFSTLASSGFGNVANRTGSTATISTGVLPDPSSTISNLTVAFDWWDQTTEFKSGAGTGAAPSLQGDQVQYISGVQGTTVHASSGDNGTQEGLQLNVQGGLNAVGSSGSAGGGYALSAGQVIAANTDFSAVAVVKQFTGGGNSRATLFSNSSTNIQMWVVVVGNVLQVQFYDGTNTLTATGTVDLTAAFNIIEISRVGSTKVLTIYVNGTSIGTTTPGTAPAFTLNSIDNFVGTGENGSFKLAHRLWNGHTLTATERGEMKAYFDSKMLLFNGSEVNTSLLPSTASADWLPTATSWTTTGISFTGITSQNPYNRAVQAFRAAGVDTVVINIGVNDASNSVSTSTYLTNMTTIVNQLVADGFRVIIDRPFDTSTHVTTGYITQLSTIAAAQNPFKVVLGTGAGEAFWSVNISNVAWAADGVHPTAVGQTVQEAQITYEVDRAFFMLAPPPNTFTEPSVLSKSIAGAADTTLSTSEGAFPYQIYTGVITGNVNVIEPLVAGKQITVFNNTSGAFTVTIKSSSGTGIVVATGKRAILMCDGTNWVRITADTLDFPAWAGIKNNWAYSA